MEARKGCRDSQTNNTAQPHPGESRNRRQTHGPSRRREMFGNRTLDRSRCQGCNRSIPRCPRRPSSTHPACGRNTTAFGRPRPLNSRNKSVSGLLLRACRPVSCETTRVPLASRNPDSKRRYRPRPSCFHRAADAGIGVCLPRLSPPIRCRCRCHSRIPTRTLGTSRLR